MKTKIVCMSSFIAAALSVSGCSKKNTEPPGVVIQAIDFSSLEDTKTFAGVRPQIDETLTEDGNGSVKISTQNPQMVPIAQWRGLDVRNSSVVCQANVQTEGFTNGSVFLEVSAGKTFSGTPGVRGERKRWSPIDVKMDFGPTNPPTIMFKLNMNGTGTVWVDWVRCYKEVAGGEEETAES